MYLKKTTSSCIISYPKSALHMWQYKTMSMNLCNSFAILFRCGLKVKSKNPLHIQCPFKFVVHCRKIWYILEVN